MMLFHICNVGPTFNRNRIDILSDTVIYYSWAKQAVDPALNHQHWSKQILLALNDLADILFGSQAT